MISRALALAACLVALPALAQDRPMWARRAPPEYQHLPTGPVRYVRLPTIEASERACADDAGPGDHIAPGSTACARFYKAEAFRAASGRMIRKNSLCVITYSDPRQLPHELDHCRVGRAGGPNGHSGWR